MKGIIAAVVSVVVALALLSSCPQSADALSCARPRPANEEFRESEVVFRGEAVSKKRAEKGDLVAFRIVASWKGPASGVIELYESGMWFEYEQGAEYLIFAKTDRDGLLRANVCGRTAKWEVAKGDAAAFGKPQLPEGTGEKRSMQPAALLVAGTGGFAIAVAILIRRRFKRKG